MKQTKILPASLLGMMLLSSAQTASSMVIATLDTTFTTTVAANGTSGAATVNSGLTPVGEINIRERRSATQTDRRIASFLGFDLSSITIAQVNDPTFEAIFSTVYVSRLNDLNAAGAVVGTTTGTSFTFADAAGTGAAELIANIAASNPGVAGVSVDADVTTFVQDFVNSGGTDFALTLYIPILEAQAAGFDNPELTLSVDAVPEPSSLALLALGLLPLARRRR